MSIITILLPFIISLIHSKIAAYSGNAHQWRIQDFQWTGGRRVQLWPPIGNFSERNGSLKGAGTGSTPSGSPDVNDFSIFNMNWYFKHLQQLFSTLTILHYQ